MTEEVTISIQRYKQLVKAEAAANMFVELIDDRYKHYGTINNQEVKMLHIMLFGQEEADE